MRELSLHILDVAENSIAAGADYLRIAIDEKIECNTFYIHIVDNGMGMDAETLKNCQDPFFTTKTDKKYGLGIPLFKASAEQCDGSFIMSSTEGVGTEIEITYKHSHIDRMPLGGIEDTIASIIISKPDIDMVYTHSFNDNKFSFETSEIRRILGDVPIVDPSVLSWMKSFIRENIDDMSINGK